MMITINLLEVASELAHDSMVDELKRTEDIISDYEVYTAANAQDLDYTEQAQNCFNMWYDYYSEILLKHEVK